MDLKSLNLTNCKTDGRQEILPSVFPFYNQSEKDKIFALNGSDRVDKIASHLKVNPDEGEFETVCLDENLYVCDLTCGGEDNPRFSLSVSPTFISAVIDAISQMRLSNKEQIVLGVPADSGLLISAYILKGMGFPIERIVVASDSDLDSHNFCLVDVSCEDLFEYISDFYEDFDFLLGIEEAKTALALEIYTDGFTQKSLIINAFGFSASLSDCAFALSGKRKNQVDSAKWIAENCALPEVSENLGRKFQQIDKNLMKELCNLL